MPRRARHDSAVTAILTGIVDLFEKRETVAPLSPGISLEGRSALITGANSGLGKATAIHMSTRDCRIMMGCRSGIPDAAHEISAASRNSDVQIALLDLADLDSVTAFCEGMKKRGERFDIVILNAGVVPAQARQTKDGFEEMFQVNYLSNFLLVNTLLKTGVVPNSIFLSDSADRAGKTNSEDAPIPRIVFVSSESHRSSRPIDFDRLGEFREYGMSGSVAEYGYTKLLLSTYAAELARRLAPGGVPQVSVHALCPGPVNTRIAREAPALVQPLLQLIFGIFFRSPKKASEPILYLAGSPEIEGTTGRYLHLMSPKKPSPEAMDPENGRLLWEASLKLLTPRGDRPGRFL
jgi:NAD(P)-dependent dehydrogenase (short-subunit alcohol dehydrogenase family)